MTAELEEEFFKCFDITKRQRGYCDCDSYCPNEDLRCGENCSHWKYTEPKYPDITDRILLELYCIQKIYIDHYVYSTSVERLKDEILQVLIDYKEVKEAYKQGREDLPEFVGKVQSAFRGKMKKYIIKNCPAICINHNNEYDCDKAEYSCQGCTDCAMKQIVELCKMYVGNKDNMFLIARYALADDILNLLEIEECE